MYPQTLRTIVVGLVGLLGLVLATAEVHPHAYHRGGVGIGQHYAQLVKDDLQKPPTGPVYRCHDPHPEIFVSFSLLNWFIVDTLPHLTLHHLCIVFTT